MKSKPIYNAAFLFGILYFLFGVLGVYGELTQWDTGVYIARTILPLLLMAIYLYCSRVRDTFYLILMGFSLLTNIFMIPKDLSSMNFALLAFMCHRILMIYYTFRNRKITDFIPIVIGTIPFLVIYFYLFLISSIPESSFFLLIVHNILVSILCGIGFATYILRDNKTNTWLLISVLLFGVMHFNFFIQRIYLIEDLNDIFGAIAVILNVFGFFSYLQFVLHSERSDQDRPAST